MADEDEKDAGPEAAADEAAKPKVKLSPAIIIALANTLLVLAALGVFAYTKIIYQRPVIVENTELAKKQAELKEPAEIPAPPMVSFDKMRINIAMTSDKAHYATIAFATQCRDSSAVITVKQKKDLFVDKVISAFGRRQMTELNTIQGKLMLKSELLREFNGLTAPGTVTDIYFSEFILQ